MATIEQVQRVQEVQAQKYADWEAVHHDEQLAMLARLQEQEGLKELNRLQTKLVRPLGNRTLGHTAEDVGGVLVASFTAGILADNLNSYATVEEEPQAATLPIETRRSFGASALSHELRINPSTPSLVGPEVYTGYAAA